MKIYYNIDDQTWCEKEQDWAVEECESKGGHCWVEYQGCVSTNSYPSPRTRTCKHCGLKQELEVIHQENWKTISNEKS